MRNFDFSDKIYNAARRRGYLELAVTAPEEFELSFVGVWVCKYKNDLKVLGFLAQIVGKQIVEWSDLTERNLKNFKELVLKKQCANSARTTFAKLNSVLNDMKDEIVLPCKRFAEILKCKGEPSQSVFLNEREIKRLESIEPESKEEQYVKCLYLLECYCGARHSDIINMTEDNIHCITDENGKVTSRYISYISQKTRIEANIPLHRNFEDCLNGYDKSIEINDCKFNDILRELCRRAKINEKTKLFRRGKWEEGPKYQFVSTHVGRKSFCSDLYLRGVDTRTISKMAGHASSQTTERSYIVPMRKLNDTAMSFFN